MKKLLVAICLLSPATHAADFAEIYREAVTAWQNEDYVGMAEQTRQGLEMRPGYPLMTYMRAMALAGQGDDEQALDLLTQLDTLQVRVAALDAENFPSLAGKPEFEKLATRSDALATLVIGEATTAFKIPQYDFLSESLVRDDAGKRWLVGGVHHSMIVAVADDGSQSLFAQGGPLGGPLSMAIDAERGLLWVASGVLDESRRNDDAIRGVLAYDLASGELRRSVLLPLPDANPGDLYLDTTGDLYVSDGINGVVYRMMADEAELAPLLEDLSSPQGIAIDDTGVLWVADYRGGLISFDPESIQPIGDAGTKRRSIRYSLADNASLYGIDGLVFNGRELIAIQNGINPHRIISIGFDDGNPADVRILAMNLRGFDEPTLGRWHDGAFYFIANSQWGKFGDPENPPGPDDANPPAIMRLELADH